MNSFFRDAKGRVVIVQAPNRWVYIAVLGYVAMRSFEDSGHIDVIGFILYYGGGFYWAWLEITQGVNKWRKSLGLIVAVILLKSLFMRIF